MHSQDHLSPTLSSVLIIYVMSGSSDCSLAARLNRYLMLIMNERHTQTHSHRNEAHTPERRNKARQVGFKHAGLESLSESKAEYGSISSPGGVYSDHPDGALLRLRSDLLKPPALLGCTMHVSAMYSAALTTQSHPHAEAES